MGIHEAILKDCRCASWTQRWGERALSRVSMSPHPPDLVSLTLQVMRMLERLGAGAGAAGLDWC